jgi:hypothetical protein
MNGLFTPETEGACVTVTLRGQQFNGSDSTTHEADWDGNRVRHVLFSLVKLFYLVLRFYNW